MKREKEIKKFVKDRYGRIASGEACCPSCACDTDLVEQAKAVGYSEQEIGSVPEEAVMSLGCGNPTALAELREGETVLDLGSGGGLDVFLAAKKLGGKGESSGWT